MRKKAQKASNRKPYEKPQIKQVELEPLETTLGTSACYGPGPGFVITNCGFAGAGCALP